jgi:hypothetical protein
MPRFASALRLKVLNKLLTSWMAWFILLLNGQVRCNLGARLSCEIEPAVHTIKLSHIIVAVHTVKIRWIHSNFTVKTSACSSEIFPRLFCGEEPGEPGEPQSNEAYMPGPLSNASITNILWKGLNFNNLPVAANNRNVNISNFHITSSLAVVTLWRYSHVASS